VKLLRGIDASLDKEAMRVVSASPKWEPGRQRDRAVNVTYTFPVVFTLR
jgi:protein TonB